VAANLVKRALGVTLGQIDQRIPVRHSVAIKTRADFASDAISASISDRKKPENQEILICSAKS